MNGLFRGSKSLDSVRIAYLLNKYSKSPLTSLRPYACSTQLCTASASLAPLGRWSGMLARQTRAHPTKPRAPHGSRPEQHVVHDRGCSGEHIEDVMQRAAAQSSLRHVDVHDTLLMALGMHTPSRGVMPRRFVAECAHSRHSSPTYMTGPTSTEARARVDIARTAVFWSLRGVPWPANREGSCRKVKPSPVT